MLAMRYISWFFAEWTWFSILIICDVWSFKISSRFIESAKFEKSQIKRYEQGIYLIKFWIWNLISDKKKSETAEAYGPIFSF